MASEWTYRKIIKDHLSYRFIIFEYIKEIGICNNFLFYRNVEFLVFETKLQTD